MKNFVILAAISLFVGISGCKKDENNPSGGGNTTVTPAMSAKVDGQGWSSQSVIAQKTGSDITITGTAPSGIQVAVTLKNVTSTGKVTLNPEGSYGSWMDNMNFSYLSSIYDGSGEVNVTMINDKSIKGTFTFVAKKSFSDETKTVTEGSFSANYFTGMGMK